MKRSFNLTVALLLVSTSGISQRAETLGSVKQKYLNQKVVFIGYVAQGLRDQPVLMEWHFGTEVAGRYKADMERYLPATYKGKTATVIAIQLNDLQKTPDVNALGESVSPDSMVNPYFNFVVKLDDGEVVMTSAYPNTIPDDVRLASEGNAIAQEMAAQLPSIVGKNFYACGFSDLYSTDATLAEILGTSRILKELTDVPLLVPLKVAVAKYDESENAVILKLNLPDGREALAVASGERLADKDETFMQRISASLLREIPKKLTLQEIAAIKKRSVFRGMSKNALYYSLGLPKSENDWGRGGKQFVYADTLMVYVDNQDKVVDWQLLNN